jgi:hypothetical protein
LNSIKHKGKRGLLKLPPPPPQPLLRCRQENIVNQRPYPRRREPLARSLAFSETIKSLGLSCSSLHALLELTGSFELHLGFRSESLTPDVHIVLIGVDHKAEVTPKNCQALLSSTCPIRADEIITYQAQLTVDENLVPVSHFSTTAKFVFLCFVNLLIWQN